MIVGGIVQVGSVRRVIVERIRICRIYQAGAGNTHGIKVAVCASYHMKVEEMRMPLITIQMVLLMLEFGKLITLTGVNVVMGRLLVILRLILHVLSKFINGEEIHSNCGPHILLVDAEENKNKKMILF